MDYAPVVLRRPSLWLATLALIACNAGPIVWGEARELTGAPHWLRPTPPDDAPRLPAAACAATARLASSPEGRWHGVWWSVRADSSAEIVAGVAKDRTTWLVVRVDSADVAKTGCRRQAPAIALDGPNVHLVYAMQAREAPGIFSAHSMDGGTTFHSPVAVVYGERPGAASVAARGDLVIIAFEDPNTTPARISVAVSKTMAHLFEYREVVSPPGRAAAAPRVATSGDSVVLMWSPVPADSAASHFTRSGAVK